MRFYLSILAFRGTGRQVKPTRWWGILLQIGGSNRQQRVDNKDDQDGFYPKAMIKTRESGCESFTTVLKNRSRRQSDWFFILLKRQIAQTQHAISAFSSWWKWCQWAFLDKTILVNRFTQNRTEHFIITVVILNDQLFYRWDISW